MYEYEAELIRVVDGDTVDLELDLGLSAFRKERFRLYGVDTPEIHGVKKSSEEYAAGIAAKQFVEGALTGRKFKVHTIKDRKGKYGRYLAKIVFQSQEGLDLDLGEELLSKGLAKEYP